MNSFAKFLIPFLTVVIFMQTSHAAESISDLILEYQYSMTVEWDQHDSAFADYQKEQLKKGISRLIQEGTTSRQILQQSAEFISDANTKAQVLEAVSLYGEGVMSEEQLIDFTDKILDRSGQEGTSWSPVLKLIAGIAGGYIIFKLVLLAIYFHDTDPNYGQTEPPTKEP